MTASEEDEVREGSVLAARWRLDRLLGTGGMGRVFLGHDLTGGADVAVKVMHRVLTFDPVLTRRFEREARAAMIVDHPNVVRVVDFGREESTRFIVMEYIEGDSLADVIERFEPGSMPIEVIVELLAQVADALAAAHDKGLVHRDLKPENVLVTERGGAGVARVLDFGLVKMTDPEVGATLTQADQVAGTPAYMSPEQCRSLLVGPSADLYSLGCILHEMLSGHVPFTGASAIDVIARQMFLPVPPAARAAGVLPIPPGLEALRKELLAKEPSERPADAATVAERLRSSLDDDALPAEPTAARPSRAPRGAAFPPTMIEPATRGEHSIALVRVGGTRLVGDELVLALGAHGVSTIPGPTPAALRGARVDVLVVDGGEDVVAACATIRAAATDLPGCPVLALLASFTNDELSRLIEAGAGDVARPPFAADGLVKRIKRLGRRRRASS